jgi:hypothetical protein
MTVNPRPLLLVGIVAIVLAACAGTPNPSPSSPAQPSPIAAVSPSASPLPSAQPETEPSGPVTPADPSAKPDPTPARAPAVWSKARTVKGLDGCSSVVATIDDAGVSHLAATCGNAGGEVRYASSSDGLRWSVKTFKAPPGRFERDPQLALAGSTLSLAYTRVAPDEEGCGTDGLSDVGVYVRSRTLPGGDWSAPGKFGATADHLQALRADGTVLHAIVANDKSDAAFYERVSNGSVQRVRIGGATGSTALRIGDDGVARVAMDGAKGILFGTVDGGKLSTSTIPGTSNGSGPVMALGPGNTAYVLLTRRGGGSGGCIDGDPGPSAGTYLSTNVGGSWSTTRLSKHIGASSITMDPASGEVDALVGDFTSLQLFQKAPNAGWTHRTLTTDFASSAVVRRNPATGGLLVAFVHDTLDGEIPATVQVMTKG